MSYKDKLYSKYRSIYTGEIYGRSESSGSSFYAYNSYFGKFLPEDKNARILDAGCGNGEFVSWLHKKEFKDAEGIDISEEEVEIAHKAGRQNIRRGDIKNLEGNYDLIFLRDVLEHFTKEEALDVLEILRSRLSTGGALIIQTVNAKNPLWGRLRHGDFTHDLAFTEESISQILRANDFKNISIFPQRPAIHGMFSAIRYIFWMCFELRLKFYLLIETGFTKGIFTQNLIVKAIKR